MLEQTEQDRTALGFLDVEKWGDPLQAAQFCRELEMGTILVIIILYLFLDAVFCMFLSALSGEWSLGEWIIVVVIVLVMVKACS